MKLLYAGEDLGFSRGGGGGGGFSKNYRIFFDFFSRSTKLIFELSKSIKKSLFWPNFLRRRQNFECALFGNFDQKTTLPQN